MLASIATRVILLSTLFLKCCLALRCMTALRPKAEVHPRSSYVALECAPGAGQVEVGRSRVSDGIRKLRGRYSRPSTLHRPGLQHSQTPLRARLPEARAIRAPTRPASGQNRRLQRSTAYA